MKFVVNPVHMDKELEQIIGKKMASKIKIENKIKKSNLLFGALLWPVRVECSSGAELWERTKTLKICTHFQTLEFLQKVSPVITIHCFIQCNIVIVRIKQYLFTNSY